MKRVTPIGPDETKFELETELGVKVVDATELMAMWDDSAKGQPLTTRYEALRVKLSGFLGVEVSIGYAYAVLDTAVGIVTDLKKTRIVSAD
jgi:hypothetical protein